MAVKKQHCITRGTYVTQPHLIVRSSGHVHKRRLDLEEVAGAARRRALHRAQLPVLLRMPEGCQCQGVLSNKLSEFHCQGNKLCCYLANMRHQCKEEPILSKTGKWNEILRAYTKQSGYSTYFGSSSIGSRKSRLQKIKAK